MSTVQGGQGRIITDGLAYLVDAANPRSFINGNSTWTDISGNGYNGTLNGGVTYDSNNSGSLKFDGTDEFISLGTATPKLYAGTNSYTWSSWLKFGSNTTSNRQVWYGNSGGGNDGFSFIMNPTASVNRIQVEIFGTTGGRQQRIFTVTSYLNTWNFWTVVLDATTYTRTVYVNNVILASEVISNWGDLRQEPSAGFNGLYIGCYNGTTWFYDGFIGNILVYNKALSTSEVLQNYNATRARFGI